MKSIEEVQQSVEANKITLPDNIKEEIRNNAAQLKELLKDEKEFLIKLVIGINSLYPDFVRNSIFEHYDSVIQESKKQYKPWPKIIDEVDKLTYSLYSLLEVENQLFWKRFKDMGSDIRIAVREIIKEEIILQFKGNDNISYDYDFNVDEYHILGELPSDTDNKEFE